MQLSVWGGGHAGPEGSPVLLGASHWLLLCGQVTRWQEVTTRCRDVEPDPMSTGVTRIIRSSLPLAPLPSNTGALPLCQT